MEDPGSGSPPKIFNLAYGCTDAGVGQVVFDVNKVISETTLSVALLIKASGTPVWNDGFGPSVNGKHFQIDDVANNIYVLTASNGEAEVSSEDIEINCTPVGGGGGGGGGGGTGPTLPIITIPTLPRLRYHLLTRSYDALRYHLRTRQAGIRYHLRTRAIEPLPAVHYHLRTRTTPLRYHLRTTGTLPETEFQVQITQDGERLLIILPRVQPGTGLRIPAPPTVIVNQLDGAVVYPTTLLDVTDDELNWYFESDALSRDGVYYVEVLFADRTQLNAGQHVLVHLRLQFEQAREMLKYQDDYNENAADLELWLASAVLCFEQKEYEQVDYLLESLFQYLIPTLPL